MCSLTLTAASSSAASSRLVCYYNSLAENRVDDGKCTISDIDPNHCTHVIYAFSDINNQHKLVPNGATDVQRYQTFNGLKNRNPQLKTLLAVGGLNFKTKKFSAMVATRRNRAKFIRSAIKLLRANKFDGLNLDWRYPGGAGCQPQDKQRFTLLCKELKKAFVAEGRATNHDRLLLTASVSAEKAIIDASYEVAQIAIYLDFINVLTFDFHGPWESVTGHHSPLFQGSQDTGNQTYLNTDFAMQYWSDQGAPKEKLNMGLAAYGRAFELSSASSDVGAPANGAGERGRFTGEEGFLAYYETCLYLERVKVQLITDQKVPYATTGNQWVGFDNHYSLGIKVSYLKVNNFGGAVVWSLDLDGTSGQFCNMGSNPFISHLHILLVSGHPDLASTTPTTTTTTPAPTTPAPTTPAPTTPAPTTPAPTTPAPTTPAPTTPAPTTPAPTTPAPTTPAPTTPAPTTASSDPCNGEQFGFFPNTEDPGSFYNCAFGIGHLQFCLSGQVFSTVTLTCV